MATCDGKEPPTLRRDWTTRFIASNPFYYKVKQKPLKINYAIVTDPIAINKWYKLYQTPPPIVQQPPLPKPPLTLITPRSVKRLIMWLYTIASTLDRKEKWLYKKLLREAYQNAYC
jgi:hypothetical protein